ncbi:MAG: hypothetical protein L0338_04670 [Acidobacteria bacterium]|nr:hypothetical protein [Acidobacteriota bacterium]
MELPVELNGGAQTARVKFADKNDLGFLTEWRLKLGDDKNPLRNDSVDFAQLAVSRFEIHSSIEAYASAVEDIGDHIQTNPLTEVAAFVILTCDWFPDSRVISICHFRRTWSNRIILDYLAAHPFITRRPSGYPHKVRGSGVALLYFLSLVAKRYNCDAIWGEATQGSCDFYKKAFGLDSVEDLIYVPREKYMKFIESFDNNMAKKGKAVATDDGGVLALEENNPPFVGSKTAVFNPVRRLARHFLDLPHHVQIEIVGRLGLVREGDEGQMTDEQFRRFFRRVSEDGKLSGLWRAVEEQHPDGEPDKNPFPKS